MTHTINAYDRIEAPAHRAHEAQAVLDNTEFTLTPEAEARLAKIKAERDILPQRRRRRIEEMVDDAALSTWADGVTDSGYMKEERLIRNGGLATFPALYDLDGNRVKAALIDGKYGLVWKVMHDDGTVTWIKRLPARESTNRKKGYVEGWEAVPAEITRTATSRYSVYVGFGRLDDGYPPHM